MSTSSYVLNQKINVLTAQMRTKASTNTPNLWTANNNFVGGIQTDNLAVQNDDIPNLGQVQALIAGGGGGNPTINDVLLNGNIAIDKTQNFTSSTEGSNFITISNNTIGINENEQNTTKINFISSLGPDTQTTINRTGITYQMNNYTSSITSDGQHLSFNTNAISFGSSEAVTPYSGAYFDLKYGSFNLTNIGFSVNDYNGGIADTYSTIYGSHQFNINWNGLTANSQFVCSYNNAVYSASASDSQLDGIQNFNTGEYNISAGGKVQFITQSPNGGGIILFYTDTLKMRMGGTFGDYGQVLGSDGDGNVIWTTGGDVYLANDNTFIGNNAFAGLYTQFVNQIGLSISNSYGNNGDVLTSGGDGQSCSWTTPIVYGDVFLANKQTFTDINTFNNITKFNDEIVLSNTSGTAGQVLTATSEGNAPIWTTPTVYGDVFLANKQTFTNINTFNNITKFNDEIVLSNTSGTAGQVLTATSVGNAPIWTTPTTYGDVYLNGDNIFIGNNTFNNVMTCNGDLNLTDASINMNISPTISNLMSFESTYTANEIFMLNSFNNQYGISGSARYYLEFKDGNLAQSLYNSTSDSTLGQYVINSNGYTLNSSNGINLSTGLTKPLIVNGTTGTNGQILTTNANGYPTWQNAPASSFVGTATSNLNMSNYNINNCSSIVNSAGTLTVGSAGQTTSLVGNCNFPTQFSYGNTGQYLFYGGNGGNNITTTTNLQTSISISKPVNIQYTATLNGTTAGQTLTLLTAQIGYFMYVVNLSTQNWTISRNGSDVILGSYGGASSTSFILPPNKSILMIQSIGVYVIVSETIINSYLQLNYAPPNTTPNIISLSGGLEFETKTATGNIGALNTLNKNYMCRFTGGIGQTLTLPTVNSTGYYITIRNDASSITTLNIASGAGTIIFDNSIGTPISTYTLANHHSITLYSVNGTGWLMTGYA
jgi:hypothetical protein